MNKGSHKKVPALVARPLRGGGGGKAGHYGKITFFATFKTKKKTKEEKRLRIKKERQAKGKG